MDGDSKRLVVVGDRRHLLGACLATLLNDNGYLAEVQPDVELAIKEAARIGALLAIVDIDQPVDAALGALHDARSSGHAVPVLAVAHDIEHGIRRKALLAGAQAVLSRAQPTDIFLRCVEHLCRGDAVLPELEPPPEDGAAAQGRPWTDLTPREIEILHGLAQGSSTDELSQQLGLQHATVRTYVQRVLMKLGVHNRAAAVAAGISAGVVRPRLSGEWSVTAAPGRQPLVGRR